MAQALKARANGHAKEWVQYARDFGIFEMMRRFEIKDYMAAVNFLEQEAPGEVFCAPTHNPHELSRPDAFDRLLEAMLRKYSALEAQSAKLAGENSELTRQLDYYKAVRWNQASGPVQAILRECGEQNQ